GPGDHLGQLEGGGLIAAGRHVHDHLQPAQDHVVPAPLLVADGSPGCTTPCAGITRIRFYGRGLQPTLSARSTWLPCRGHAIRERPDRGSCCSRQTAEPSEVHPCCSPGTHPPCPAPTRPCPAAPRACRCPPSTS